MRNVLTSIAWLQSKSGAEALLPEAVPDIGHAARYLRANFLRVQTLVAVVLSYHLLFSPEARFMPETRMLMVLGLLTLCASIMLLPAWMILAEWFAGTLAILDTLMTTALIYIAGNSHSDLYLAYFVIILLVTASRTTLQMAVFLTLVTTIYGFVLYEEVKKTGVILPHHLIRIPLLLIMGIFYRRIADSVRLLAYYDPLTGLPNRRHFRQLVLQKLAPDRAGSRKHAVLAIGLDGVKLVNETLGQELGDRLLKAVTTRLTQCVRPSDILARSGPDEFAMLLHEIDSPETPVRLARRLLTVMAPAFALDGHDIFLTLNIGIAMVPSKDGKVSDLVKHAEAALSRAKARGKNEYECYSPDIDERAYRRLRLESRLQKALEREELVVYYQPQVSLGSKYILGLEAPARWNNLEVGLVPPSQFIALAEETGLIIPIGTSILRQACQHLKQWHEAGHRALHVSVNLSSRQFTDPQLAAMIEHTLSETGVAPSSVELELTETCVLHEAEATLATLHQLKAMGLRIAIDDFGTGYSSLMYLRRFPIDTLKIDRAFTQDLSTSADALAIVRAIIAMAEALKLKVVAEGVETEAQIELLQALGCHEGQGFAFSPPIAPEEMTALLRRWPNPADWQAARTTAGSRSRFT